MISTTIAEIEIVSRTSLADWRINEAMLPLLRRQQTVARDVVARLQQRGRSQGRAAWWRVLAFHGAAAILTESVDGDSELTALEKASQFSGTDYVSSKTSRTLIQSVDKIDGDARIRSNNTTSSFATAKRSLMRAISLFAAGAARRPPFSITGP